MDDCESQGLGELCGADIPDDCCAAAEICGRMRDDSASERPGKKCCASDEQWSGPRDGACCGEGEACYEHFLGANYCANPSASAGPIGSGPWPGDDPC